MNHVDGHRSTFWTIAIPVFITSIAIMGIGAWIVGPWSNTTKPIEEITSKIDEETKTEHLTKKFTC